ncbi:MAG: hypothetical protein QXS76_00220 [Candidatus Bathyarchaeia archaeon]
MDKVKLLLSAALLITLAVLASAIFMIRGLEDRAKRAELRASELQGEVDELQKKVESLSSEIQRLKRFELRRPTRSELERLLEEFKPMAELGMCPFNPCASSFFTASAFKDEARAKGYNASVLIAKVRMKWLWLNPITLRVEEPEWDEPFAFNEVILADGKPVYIWFAWPTGRAVVFEDEGDLYKIAQKMPEWAVRIW